MGASVAVDAAEAPAKGPGSAAGCKLALSSSPCGAWIIVVSGYVPNKVSGSSGLLEKAREPLVLV